MSGPEAARFVAEKIPPGPMQEKAALGAVVAWAQQDPARPASGLAAFRQPSFERAPQKYCSATGWKVIRRRQRSSRDCCRPAQSAIKRTSRWRSIWPSVIPLRRLPGPKVFPTPREEPKPSRLSSQNSSAKMLPDCSRSSGNDRDGAPAFREVE